jgi:hypothetical protein
MGIFKQFKQMKDVVAETPDLIRNAQAMQESQIEVAQAHADTAERTIAAAVAGTEGEPIMGVSLALYAEISREVWSRGGEQSLALIVAKQHRIDDQSWGIAVAGWNDRLRASTALAARFNQLWRGVG